MASHMGRPAPSCSILLQPAPSCSILLHPDPSCSSLPGKHSAALFYCLGAYSYCLADISSIFPLFSCACGAGDEVRSQEPGREAASVIKGITTAPLLNPIHYFLAHTLKMQTQLINSAFTPDSMILCLPFTSIISICHFHNTQPKNPFPIQPSLFSCVCSQSGSVGAHLELGCSCAPSLLWDVWESQPSHAEYEAITEVPGEQLKIKLCPNETLINKLVFPFYFQWEIKVGVQSKVLNCTFGKWKIVMESCELWGFGTKGVVQGFV